MKKDNKKNKNKKQDGLYAVLVFSICILIVFMIVYQLKMKQIYRFNKTNINRKCKKS